MKLQADETDIVGHWVVDGGKVEADEACKRIEYLTSHVLQKIAVSRTSGAWETLFRDPTDGKLWERTYPESELHGGGPPRLRMLSEKEARERYDF